jgi:hypothetical protein
VLDPVTVKLEIDNDEASVEAVASIAVSGITGATISSSLHRTNAITAVAENITFFRAGINFWLTIMLGIVF